LREIKADDISRVIQKLCMEANYYLPSDVIDALEEGYRKEESSTGKDILSQILKNAYARIPE